jgi:hypothetical protein
MQDHVNIIQVLFAGLLLFTLLDDGIELESNWVRRSFNNTTVSRGLCLAPINCRLGQRKKIGKGSSTVLLTACRCKRQRVLARYFSTQVEPWPVP